MVIKNFYPKPKIFVRYPPGGSGHFLSLLIISLKYPVQLSNDSSGHQYIESINQGHNFNQQWTADFRKYLQVDTDINISARWLKENFKFNEIDRDFYIVHTHAKNFLPFLVAWPESKVISINFCDNDIDQMAYNWVIKSLALDQSNEWNVIERKLLDLQQTYKKLLWIDLNTLKEQKNICMLSYISKFGLSNYSSPRVNKPDSHNVFNLNFSSITDGKFIQILNRLIKFLDIEVKEVYYKNAVQLIEHYTLAQQPVPWKLTLDLYK